MQEMCSRHQRQSRCPGPQRQRFRPSGTSGVNSELQSFLQSQLACSLVIGRRNRCREDLLHREDGVFDTGLPAGGRAWRHYRHTNARQLHCLLFLALSELDGRNGFALEKNRNPPSHIQACCTAARTKSRESAQKARHQRFVWKRDDRSSLVSQQCQRIDRERALRWNPSRQRPQQGHS